MKRLVHEFDPRQLHRFLPALLEMRTVRRTGWAGCKNGDPLQLAANHGFDAFIPSHRSFE